MTRSSIHFELTHPHRGDQSMITRNRKAGIGVSVLALSTILAGCGGGFGGGGSSSSGSSSAGSSGSSSSSSSNSSNASSSSGSAKYTITMQLQPNTGDPTSGQNKSLVAAAQAYEKLHPDVTVKFLPNSYSDIANSNAALLTRASAHSAPDIIWEQYNQADSSSIPDGVLLNLYPYLQKPNPYIKGNSKWIDAWEPQYVPYMTKSQGQMYILLASAIATGIAYNKADFQKAGITAPPSTFAAWIADMKKLKSSGITPIMFTTAGQCNLSWWERKMNSSFLANDIPKIDVNHSQVVGGIDFAAGVEKGIISMKNPQYAATWKLLGELTPYMAPGASQYDVCAAQTATSPPLSPLSAFAQNKFAMMWIHTGLAVQLNNLGFSGKYAMFPFPTVTKASSQYATGVNVQGTVGGPNGSGEWSVTTKAADETMTPDKTNQVIDFLMYLYSPTHITPLVKDMGNGAYIPILKGAASGSNPTSALLPKNAAIPKTVDSVVNATLTNEAHNQGQRILQSYVSGATSWKTFSTQWESLLQSATKSWAQQNNVDLSKYK